IRSRQGPRYESRTSLLARPHATGLAGGTHRYPRLRSNVDGRRSDRSLCARTRARWLYFHRSRAGRRRKRPKLCAGRDRGHHRIGAARGCAACFIRSCHNFEGNPRMTQYSNTGAEIELVDIVKKYPGQTQPAVDGLSLTIPAGETVMFVGPSGCGKTTLVKMINRLIEPTSGKIMIDGEDATTKDPTLLRRTIGYVIQGVGLMLTFPAGGTSMFVCPSVCGKTTLLKMINRLIDPTSGKIMIDGEDATTKAPTLLRRTIGYVIQGGGLMPHMTVADNIALVPGLLNWDKQRIRERVDELLQMTGLDPEI